MSRPELPTYMEVDTLSYRNLEDMGVIPGFEYIGEPDARWFQPGPHAQVGLEGEPWYDWSIVRLASEAVEAATALGLPIVFVSWESPWHPPAADEGDPEAVELRVDLRRYDEETRRAMLKDFADRVRLLGAEPAEIEPDVWVVYLGPQTFVGLVISRNAVFRLARYFALASRLEHRNPSYQYGSLPPGHGYGEYYCHLAPWKRVEVWVTPPDTLDESTRTSMRELLGETEADEMKPPDSTSWLTNRVDPDRDLEWLLDTQPDTDLSVSGTDTLSVEDFEKLVTALSRKHRLPAPRFFWERLANPARPQMAARTAAWNEYGRACLVSIGGNLVVTAHTPNDRQLSGMLFYSAKALQPVAAPLPHEQTRNPRESLEKAVAWIAQGESVAERED